MKRRSLGNCTNLRTKTIDCCETLRWKNYIFLPKAINRLRDVRLNENERRKTVFELDKYTGELSRRVFVEKSLHFN